MQELTVKELKDFLNLPGLGHEEDRLVIAISERGIPSVPCVTIKSFSLGFDWDRGKLILYPNEPLIRKEKNQRRKHEGSKQRATSSNSKSSQSGSVDS